MTDRLLIAAEWKAADNTGNGELSGYLSVFNVLDQGGDVVVPGAFKKTFDGWNRSKMRMPLIDGHQLTGDGVIGSVTHLAEDGYGASIRARFSSIPKAQDIRTKMIEGHLNGLSFTYEAIRSHRGMFDGQPARYLDELRVHEATVTPIPMNVHATASAKAGYDVDVHDLDRQQAELEAWIRLATLETAVDGMVAHPAAARHALDLLERGQLDAAQARLEAWAAAQPPAPGDAERAAARRAAEWNRRNEDSFALARVMATLPTCPHPACMPGRCAYR